MASKYTDKQKKVILITVFERISAGESLLSVCRDELMPVKNTIQGWINESESTMTQYAEAREERAETIFEKILDIADETSGDTYMKDGVEMTDNEAIQRSRLRVDTRKWMLGKMNPKKYAERTFQEVKQTNINALEEKTDQELQDEIDKLQKAFREK